MVKLRLDIAKKLPYAATMFPIAGRSLRLQKTFQLLVNLKVDTSQVFFRHVPGLSGRRPVIAYRAGGATETVIEDETGIFFEQQSVDSLVQALRRFQFKSFSKNKLREHAEKYSKESFKRQIMEFVSRKFSERMK